MKNRRNHEDGRLLLDWLDPSPESTSSFPASYRENRQRARRSWPCSLGSLRFRHFHQMHSLAIQPTGKEPQPRRSRNSLVGHRNSLIGELNSLLGLNKFPACFLA